MDGVVNWYPFGDMIGGALIGWGLAQLGRNLRLVKARDFLQMVFNLPAMSPTGRFAWFKHWFRILFGPEVSWSQRVAPFVGVFSISVNTAIHGFSPWWIFMICLWYPILATIMYGTAMHGFNIGWLAGSSDKAIEHVKSTLTQAFETRTQAVVVDMPSLLHLADQYKIPPNLIHQLVWPEG